MDLELTSCGVACTHRKGFRFTQRTHPDKWLYCFFESDFFSSTADGLCRGKACSFILYPPYVDIVQADVPEDTTGFVNDWLYFGGADAEAMLERMHIPVNKIIPVRLGSLLTDLLLKMQKEMVLASAFKAEKQQALFTLLCVELARAVQEQAVTETGRTSKIFEVRDRMMADFAHPWTVSELAASAGYAPSYFSSLYKKTFSVSPMEDLIAFRLTQARFMLEGNALKIEQIARQCGFGSSYYFSRLFKQKNGISPLKYKQKFN